MVLEPETLSSSLSSRARVHQCISQQCESHHREQSTMPCCRQSLAVHTASCFVSLQVLVRKDILKDRSVVGSQVFSPHWVKDSSEAKYLCKRKLTARFHRSVGRAVSSLARSDSARVSSLETRFRTSLIMCISRVSSKRTNW